MFYFRVHIIFSPWGREKSPPPCFQLGEGTHPLWNAPAVLLFVHLCWKTALREKYFTKDFVWNVASDPNPSSLLVSLKVEAGSAERSCADDSSGTHTPERPSHRNIDYFLTQLTWAPQNPCAMEGCRWKSGRVWALKLLRKPGDNSGDGEIQGGIEYAEIYSHSKGRHCITPSQMTPCNEGLCSPFPLQHFTSDRNTEVR